jgi:hypothetical protein
MPDTTPILSGETEDDFLNDPRPFVEGGDTFVLGKDILVGFSSLASSPACAAWLLRYLEPEGYRVHLVPLTPEWLAGAHQRLGGHRSDRRGGSFSRL